MTQVVSDEVWRQLDPLAGQLPPRTVRRLRLAVVLALVAGAVVFAGWRSGIVVPRIEFANNGYGAGTDGDAMRIEFSGTLVNRGWTAVEVLGVGASGPGLELVEARGVFPSTVPSGGTLDFTVVYHVTDCAVVTADEWPLPVRVSRPWGTYTAGVVLPYFTRDAPDGWRTYTGRDPYAVEWQYWLADHACHPRR